MGYIIKRSVKQMRPTKKRLLLYLLLGVLLLVVAAWTMIVNPVVLISKYIARVDYGTVIHEALMTETDSIHLSAYLFNITNSEQFQSGEDVKLKVQEIGPFTYQENRTHEGLVIDKKVGVIRYTPRHKVTFLPEESIADPKDVFVTVPNIAMLSMGSAVSDYGYLARFGFNMLTSRLKSNATVHMSVHDYLWGYEEPLIKLGNQVLSSWINFDTLGLLDRLYDKNTVLEVGATDADKFMIKTVNGVGGLKQWGYPENKSPCNSFENSYEGLAYPPELSPDRPLKLYRDVFCRFMELEYQGLKTMEYGVDGMAYKCSNRSFSMIPENECLCTNGFCYDGVSDLSPCFYGLPVAMSNAHFLDANPEIYERIEGINPDEEKHGSEFVIDPVIGVVMATKFSVQVNVMVKDVGFNAKIDKFSNMVVPVVYFKIEQPKVPDDKIEILKVIHIYGPKIIIALQVVLIVTGLFLLSMAGRTLYWSWITSRRKGMAYRSEIVDVKDILNSEPLMISG